MSHFDWSQNVELFGKVAQTNGNYLFSKNDKGAEDNAIFYSLLESCEIAGVNKLEWLTRTLEKIKQDPTEEEIKKLLPKNYRTD
ncbi:MAG: transposase domain-containing protein [Phocaeicola sp.]